MDNADMAQEAEAQQRDDAIKVRKRGAPRKKLCYRCGINSVDVNKDNLCPDCQAETEAGEASPMPGPKAAAATEECSRCHAQVAEGTTDGFGLCTKCVDDAADRQRKKTQAMSDYVKLLGDVEDLKEMTETRSFKEFVRRCRKKIDDAKERLLIADKANEIAHCQEAVKVLKKALEEISEPVEMLQKYITDMPLFAGEFKTRAQWMPDLFTVDIRKTS